MRFTDRTIAAIIAPDDVPATVDRIKASTARGEAVRRFSNLIRYLKRKGQVRDWPVEQLEGRWFPAYRDRVLEAGESKSVLATARTCPSVQRL